jgi:hypothetical protein
MGAWELGSLGAWELGSLGAWELGSLGAWEYGSLGAWELGSLGEKIILECLVIFLYVGGGQQNFIFVVKFVNRVGSNGEQPLDTKGKVRCKSDAVPQL